MAAIFILLMVTLMVFSIFSLVAYFADGERYSLPAFVFAFVGLKRKPAVGATYIPRSAPRDPFKNIRRFVKIDEIRKNYVKFTETRPAGYRASAGLYPATDYIPSFHVCYRKPTKLELARIEGIESDL